MCSHLGQQSLVVILLGFQVLIDLSFGLEHGTLSDPNRPLSRHRRFLIPADSGWTFKTAFSLVIPIKDVGSSLTLSIPFTFSFDTGEVSGRSFRDSQTERIHAIHLMEKYLSQVGGIDGRGCVLRTLCEMSQEQRHADGLLGDAMNLLLTPIHMLKSLSNTDAYIRAQQDGHWNQDCVKYHKQCPVSLFEFVDTHHYEDVGNHYYNETFPYIDDHSNYIR
ncbi:hypothetical protein TCAL_10484 [Tigriopus californicus]|uniref:Uncharacterized protein n=1 Tax=Tigriopus californicus TaxID=6832 RepID=A0A553PS18_TIGCA|nr:hypothetical protein TCAL_10484 [Tigriopus californicus]